jgi:hypothetical protein
MCDNHQALINLQQFSLPDCCCHDSPDCPLWRYAKQEGNCCGKVTRCHIFQQPHLQQVFSLKQLARQSFMPPQPLMGVGQDQLLVPQDDSRTYRTTTDTAVRLEAGCTTQPGSRCSAPDKPTNHPTVAQSLPAFSLGQLAVQIFFPALTSCPYGYKAALKLTLCGAPMQRHVNNCYSWRQQLMCNQEALMSPTCLTTAFRLLPITG